MLADILVKYIESHANVIYHLEHLTPKCKVTILAPSFNFLWYELSRTTAMAVVNCFIRYFSKYLGSNEEIQELLERFRVASGVDNALCKSVDYTLCERYVNKMDKGGDSSTPGLVELRVPTIAKFPATFVLTMKIKDNIGVKGHWKDLLRHRYFYRLLDLSLIGFKIVKNNLDKHGLIILDFNVDKVIYREYPKMLSYPSNVESGKKDYMGLIAEDSSSSRIEKKKKSQRGVGF